MKITIEKQIAFLQKVLRETEANPHIWQRFPSNNVTVAEVFPDDELDSEGAFLFTDPKMKGEFWIAMCTNGRTKGAIGSSKDHMEFFDENSAEVKLLLTRIFYSVFDVWPSASKLIDSYLAE